MDMVGKAMFSQQVGKLKDDFGFSEEEKETNKNYDPEKWAEEDAKLADQRAKRKDEQSKKQAERAANRNKIREKYGLKQSKQDQKLVEQQSTTVDAPPPKASSSAEKRSSVSSSGKSDDKCLVM